MKHGQQQERQAPHLSVKQQQLSVSISCVPPMVWCGCVIARPLRRGYATAQALCDSTAWGKQSGSISSMRFTMFGTGRQDATAQQAGAAACAAQRRSASRVLEFRRSGVPATDRSQRTARAAGALSGGRPCVVRRVGGVGRAATPPHKRHGAARRPTTARSRRDDVVSRARAGVRATSGRSCSNGGCAVRAPPSSVEAGASACCGRGAGRPPELRRAAGPRADARDAPLRRRGAHQRRSGGRRRKPLGTRILECSVFKVGSEHRPFEELAPWHPAPINISCA